MKYWTEVSLFRSHASDIPTNTSEWQDGQLSLQGERHVLNQTYGWF